MKIRLGLFREYVREVARTLVEGDDRMEGDGAGPGRDPNELHDFDIADHLRGDEEKISLGDAPDETMEESEETALFKSIKEYFLQEVEAAKGSPEAEAPSGDVDTDPPGTDAPSDAGSASAAPTGFYTPFDMDRDHSSTWYKSPGQPMGTAGDPFRGEDANAYLGFSPPATGGGEEGTTLAPQIWQLTAGSNTSQVLGANAKPDSGGVDSAGGAEETEAPGATGDGDEAEGEEPS